MTSSQTLRQLWTMAGNFLPHSLPANSSSRLAASSAFSALSIRFNSRATACRSFPLQKESELPITKPVQAVPLRGSISVGPFIAVNERHHLPRRNFSFAHEYAYVLLDRDGQGRIIRESRHNDLAEVRANWFAATLLMPESGVRQFLATRGKGGKARGNPAAFDVQLYDIVLLAHHFGVSFSAALYRLPNLGIIRQREFQTLKEQDDKGKGLKLARLLGLSEPDHHAERQFFRDRFLDLALEA